MPLRRLRASLLPVLAAVGALFSLGLPLHSAGAQTYTVESISPTPALGRVVSAASGDTVFRFAASTGLVDKVSGNGVRLDTTSTRALVTIKCSNSNRCNRSMTVTVTAGQVSSGKRARALNTFTVSANSGLTIGTITQTANGISFPVTGIVQNGRGSFYVGANFGVGDNASGTSGDATATFIVATPNHSLGATASARIFRSISLAINGSLAFGTVVRPSIGSNVVTVSELNGSRSIAGAGNGSLLASAGSRAALTVAGEGGQAFSVATPSSFSMTGPGGASLTVNLTKSAASGVLDSALGSSGTATFGVGGNVGLTAGTVVGSYSGTFQVTVQYN